MCCFTEKWMTQKVYQICSLLLMDLNILNLKDMLIYLFNDPTISKI